MDLGLEARVRDLAAVVGVLGLDRFALGGVDIGAVTAIAYAVEHEAAVSHLLLLSPWASGARYLQIPALRAAYSAEATGEQEWRLFANILGSVASGFTDPDFVRKGTEVFLHATSPQALSAFNAANARIDIRDLLPRVTAPTLVTRHVWQPQAINQAREPRLMTQIVEFWIADRDDAHHALGERLFKLIQGRFVVSDTGERDGQVVRRDVITSSTL